MVKKYIASTNMREARPRSKRLRQLGAQLVESGTVTGTRTSAGTGGGSSDGHSHSNLKTLEEISTDDDRYVWLDKAESDGEGGGYVRRKGKAKAGYADESGKLAADSPSWDEIDRRDTETLEAAKDYTDQEALSKKHDDTAEGVLTLKERLRLEKGLSTPEYDTAGNEDNLLGHGFELVKKGNGRTRLEVDELLVRMKAYFAKLEIRELSYVGGNYLFSAAGSRLDRVVWLDGNGNELEPTSGNAGRVATYRCYWKQDDGETSTMNYWVEGDQARCETFNIEEGEHTGASNKWYWRLVTGCGKDYVDLSGTDCADGSDVPEAGDSIVQLGHRGESERRKGCIMIDVESDNSPAIYEYSGIENYSLGDPTLMLSPRRNVIYGEFHSVVEGETDNHESIDDQIKSLLESLRAIEQQRDERMQIWYGTGEPLPSTDHPDGDANSPSKDWADDDERGLHEQDIYYDLAKEATSAGGRAWRWRKQSNGSYLWEPLTDTDTLAALEKIRDVAGDGELTGGAEKGRVLVDWLRAVDEYRKYMALTVTYGTASAGEAYDSAFRALGALLNGGSPLEITADSVATPLWLQDIGTSTKVSDPQRYRSAWQQYYSALGSVVKALQEKSKEAGDAAMAEAVAKVAVIVSDDVPEAGTYKTGDLWIQPGNGNNVMLCTADPAQGDASDWEDLSDLTAKTDSRRQLAVLVEKVYVALGSSLTGKPKNGWVSVWLDGDGTGAQAGDLWLAGGQVQQKGEDGVWSTLDNEPLVRVMLVVKEQTGAARIRIYNQTPTDSHRESFDMIAMEVSYKDRRSETTLKGGLEIRLWNGRAWEVLEESVRGVMENLGDCIRLVVFGSNDGNIESSGLMLKTDFGEMFSQSVNEKGVITEAKIGTYTKDFVSEEGVREIVSGVRISADKIDFEGKEYNVDAEKVDFKGKTVINGKFEVSDDGDVTMSNATVKGNLYTPYYEITDANIDEVSEYTYDSQLGIYIRKLNLEKTGLNIQIMLSTSNTTYLSLPGDTAYTGAEANIVNLAGGKVALLNISRVFGNGSYELYHPMLTTGQKIKLKSLSVNGVNGWYPDTVTDMVLPFSPSVLAYGRVTVSYVDSNWSVELTMLYTAYPGEFSVTREGTGQYKINFPSSWNGRFSLAEALVMVCGLGTCYLGTSEGNRYCKATLLQQTLNFFRVGTSDDDSANDGHFSFMIMSASRLQAWQRMGGSHNG